MIKAVLIDLDGVIYQADQPIPGAQRTLDWLKARRIPYLFVTNTTSRPRDAVVEKLRLMDIQIKPQEVLTPVVAVAGWLNTQGAVTIASFLPKTTQKDLSQFAQWAGTDDGCVSAVIVGDLAEEWSFGELNRAFRLLMSNPDCPLLALGLSRYWRSVQGLQLDVGPFVKALEFATGRAAIVFGKPSRDFFQQALTMLDVKASEALMIGDDIRGDVGGAQAAGLKAALVKTGKFQQTDLSGDIVPDGILASFAELPAYWKSLE
ncbi:TIGR01458 family HAD-type hydrolase [Pontibacterium sinense]|uniref:TIGR01458 family HAD-type hydrolase n=1 Tax=Pontibacterium sinense TaxID=2781979 RepID=UPI0035307892